MLEESHFDFTNQNPDLDFLEKVDLNEENTKDKDKNNKIKNDIKAINSEIERAILKPRISVSLKQIPIQSEILITNIEDEVSELEDNMKKCKTILRNETKNQMNNFIQAKMEKRKSKLINNYIFLK